jgi:hypothetical protein
MIISSGLSRYVMGVWLAMSLFDGRGRNFGGKQWPKSRFPLVFLTALLDDEDRGGVRGNML